MKLIAALCVMQAPEYQDTGYQLGYNGRNPDACYIQMKTDDQEQIQYCINHSGYDQEDQRTFGIPTALNMAAP